MSIAVAESPAPTLGGWTFPNLPESVRAARALAVGRLAEVGWEAMDEPVRLVVSELASNAVRYSGGNRFYLELRVFGTDRLRLLVWDCSRELPVLLGNDGTDGTDGSEHGRGLRLVRDLSDSWGVQLPDSGGKYVWAEFRLSRRSERAGADRSILGTAGAVGHETK